MGLGKNIPDYIWKIESGRRSLEIETRRRAGAFIVKLLSMEEDRWPSKCIKEEIGLDKNRT